MILLIIIAKELCMKKLISLALTALMLLTALCTVVSAESFTDEETVYEIETANKVEFSYEGETSVTAFPRGNSLLDCLVDGDAASDVTAHNQDGIVLVCNDFIKPEYERNMAMANQPVESIPRFSFVIEYDETISFDSVYIALMHETNACVATPSGNSVIVEYSKDGSLWNPAGTDGVFYYRATELADYVMNDTSHNTAVEERIVYLGKEYKAKFIRLTFSFMQVPEDNHWRYYTNVYEWAGFTELAAASYESGKKPSVLTSEDANVENVDPVGEWMHKAEETYYYYSFTEKEYVYKEYLASDYEEDAYNAEAIFSQSGEYNVFGNKVTLYYLGEDGETLEQREIIVTAEEDTLVIDNGLEELTYDIFVAPEAPVESEPEVSEPVESTPDASEPDASEPDASEPDASEPSESKTEESEESKTVSETVSNSTLKPQQQEESSNLGLIIGIAVGVAVLIAVIAVVIVKKRK